MRPTANHRKPTFTHTEFNTMKQPLFADKIEAAVFALGISASLLLITLVIASQLVRVYS